MVVDDAEDVDDDDGDGDVVLLLLVRGEAVVRGEVDQRDGILGILVGRRVKVCGWWEEGGL